MKLLLNNHYGCKNISRRRYFSLAVSAILFVLTFGTFENIRAETKGTLKISAVKKETKNAVKDEKLRENAMPVIYVVGDSTAAPYGPKHKPMAGWGEFVAGFVKDGVKVENRAVGGRSLPSFRKEGRWDKILKELQPGDYVIIQFGHNDQKVPNPEEYARTEYKENLKRYIAEVRAKNASPILVTSVTRRVFDKQGKLMKTLKNYPLCMKEVAVETQTPLIDIYSLTREKIEKAGPEDSKKYYTYLRPGQSPNYPNGLQDNSHFNIIGAKMVAEFFANEVKRQNLPLAQWLK